MHESSPKRHKPRFPELRRPSRLPPQGKARHSLPSLLGAGGRLWPGLHQSKHCWKLVFGSQERQDPHASWNPSYHGFESRAGGISRDLWGVPAARTPGGSHVPTSCINLPSWCLGRHRRWEASQPVLCDKSLLRISSWAGSHLCSSRPRVQTDTLQPGFPLGPLDQ